ncbi:MAG TPA: FtsX-like permease family protein [Terriglobales bacterium]|nr:FtsX-like permease family protein [Terriglobales bacterium]
MSSPDTAHVARRRAAVPHTSMFLRMLWRAAVLRRGRAASALLAMVVAAAVATAMLDLYVDVQAKLRREFRKYGANVVVVARDGQSLPDDTLTTVRSTLGSGGIAVPFAYAVARTPDGRSVVVAGTDFEQAQKLNGSWWSVTAWPKASRDALLGAHAASVLGAAGKPFDLSFQGRSIRLNPVGTLQTGAAEDSRVYVSLADFAEWTHVPYSTVEISASGSAEKVSAVVHRLGQALPGVDVHPVRQVTEGEANVLGKMRSTLLVTSILIILTATVCVLATLTGWVSDRRRDFALMKALGASGRMLQGFFAAEAAALGAIGAILGFAIGVGVAIWIGQANFHAPVTPRLSVLPIVLAGGIVIALIAAILPISLLRQVQPATILRGE